MPDNELSIQLGVELDQSDLGNVKKQIDDIKGGKNDKINLSLGKEINTQLSNLKKSISDISNKEHSIKFNIDQKVFSDLQNIVNSLNNGLSQIGNKVTQQVQQATEKAVKATQNTQQSTGTAATNIGGVDVYGNTKYYEELIKAANQMGDALADTDKKLSVSSVNIRENMDGSLNAVVNFKNALGELASVSFKDEGNGWEIIGDSYRKSFEDVTKIISDAEAKLNQISKGAFSGTNALTGDFATEAKKQIDDVVSEFTRIKEAANNSMSEAANISKDEINRMLDELKFSLDQLAKREYPSDRMAAQNVEVKKMSAIDDIAEQEEKLKNLGLATSDFSDRLLELRNRIDDLGKVDSDVSAWANWRNDFQQLEGEISKFENSTMGLGQKLASGIETGQLQQVLDMVDRLNNIDSQFSGAGVEQLQQNLQSLATEYMAVIEQLQSPTLTTEEFEQLSNKVKELQDQFKQAQNAVKIFNDGFKNEADLKKYEQNAEAVRMKFEQLQKQYENLARSNPQIAQRFKEVQDSVNNMDPTNISTASKEVSNFARELQNASGQSAGLRGALQDAFGGLGSYLARFTSSMFIISKAIQGIKSMVSAVKEVDSSLLELQKVTNLSGSALDEFTDKSYKLGASLGRTGSDVIDAAATFSRAGYDLQEATELAQSALVMTNVGVDIPNTEAAASDMISILKAFDVQAEESMDVIDKLYNVANKEPLDFGNITQMLVTAGGTLAQTGTSLEETMGLLTGAFATMRDTSVSNGLVMISQRLRGVKEDGEAIEEEGFMPKLQAMFSDVGISIQDQNGELRSTFDILNDLAGVWDQLSSKQKQYFGEKVAGNRQVKTLNAIMQNWDVVADTIDKANNAQGAAIEGNEMYMDSIAGKITQLKSAWQELATTTINSDFIKGFVDIGTAVVKLTTNIGGLAPVLTTVLGLFVAIKGANIAEAFKAIGSAIISAISGIGSATTIMSGWIGIAIAVAGAIYGIVNAVRNASVSLKDLEAASSNAKSNYSEQQTALSSLNDELQTTQERINELEGKTLSVVEEDELSALKEQNSELQRKIDLQNELTRIAEREAREAAVNTINAKNNATKEGKIKNGITDNLLDTLGVDYLSNYKFKDYQVYQGSMRGQIQVPSAGRVNNRELADLYMAALPKQIQERDKHQRALSLYSKSLLQEGEFTEEAQKAAQKNADLWAGYAKESETWLRNYYNYLQEQTEGISYVKNAQAGSIDAQYNEMLDLRDQIGETLMTNFVAGQDKQGQFDYIINLDKFKDQVKEISEEVKNTGTIDLEGMEVRFPDLIEEFKKYGWTPEKIQGYLVETFSSGSTTITQPFNIGLDEITLFSTTESYKNLTAAMTEQQKAGVLSYETIKTLLSDEGLKGINDYLIQTADGYMLNTDTIYDFIKAEQEESKLDIVEGIMERQIRLEDLQEQVDSLGKSQEDLAKAEELQGEISGIQSEITQLQAAALAADEATGALERYRAATKTANQDAAQDEGENAFKTVQERYKEGKVGTDEFKEGMNFLLGDNWKENFKGDIDAAYKEAQQIGKKYFGENDAKSADNFRKDLIDNGLATYDEASGKLTLVQNDLATIAETLGISEDAAESLFGLLNSYSPDDQFTFDKPIATAEQLAVAEKKLTELKEERARLEKEIEEGNAAGEDTSDLQSQLEENVETTKQLQSAVDTARKSGEKLPEEMSIDEAIAKIAELQSAIDTLKDHKITPTVEMTAEYNKLVEFLTGKDSEGNEVGFTMNVTGVEDAESKITQIDTALADIKKMQEEGAISAEVAANIKGNLNDQKDALNTYISQASELKEAIPGGDLSATITVNATDNATPTISFVNQELFGENGAQGIDGKTANATVDVDDQASDKVKSVDTDLADLNDKEAKPKVNAEDNIDEVAKKLTDLGVSSYPTEVDVGLTESSKTKFEEDLKSLLEKRELDIEVKYVDGDGAQIELGDGTTPDQVVAGTSNVITKSGYNSETGKPMYDLQNVFSWIQGLVQKNREAGNGKTDVQLEAENANVNIGDQVDLVDAQNMATQQELENESTDYLFGTPDFSDFESSAKDAVEEGVEKGAEEANPETSVDANADNITEEVQEGTPDNVETTVDADTSKMPDQIAEAAESAGPVETEVNAKTTLNPPEPQDAGGKSVSYSATMSMDTSSATNSVNAVQSDASEDQSFTLDANTNPADTKVDKTHKDAKKDESFTVNTNVNRRELDNLYSDLATKKTQEVEVKYTEVDKPTGLAVGTKNAPGGLSLVDEEGAELIEHTSKGTFELGTNNGARFTNLDKGDVVHTASETKRILSRMGKLGGFFRDGLNQAKSIFGNAFAGGKTVYGSVTLSALDRVLKRNKSGSSKGNTKSTKGTKGSNSDKALKKFEKWAAKLFDWAEIRLDRLKTITNSFLLDASNAIGYIAKNNNLDSALKSVNNEISATEKAYAEYMDTADKVAKKAKLSNKIIQKIQDGTIKVESYSPNMQKKIKQYQTWFEKAKDCQEALQDLNDQQKELAKTELDNIIKDYEYISDIQSGNRSRAEAQRELNYESGIAAVGTTTKKIGNEIKTTYGDYQADINAENKNLNNLITERTKLQEKLQSLMDQGLVVKNDDTWKEMQKQIQSLGIAILNSQTDIIKLKDEANNVKIDKLGYQVDEYATSISHTVEAAELRIAQGSRSMDKIGTYYNSIIKRTKEQNDVLAEQNKAYREQQSGLDKTSGKYQELEKKIQQNISTINQNNQSVQEYTDKINQIQFDKIGYKLGELSDEATRFNDDISDKTLKGIRITSQAYQNLINNGNKQIATLQSEKDAYQELNDAMVTQYGEQAKQSAKYKENEAAIRGLDAQVRQITQSTYEWKKAQENLAIQELDWMIAGDEATIKAYNDQISIRQAQGQYVDRSIYDSLSASANQEISRLQEQTSLYMNQRRNMDVYSQAYQELTDKIRDNNSKVRELTISIEEWDDAIDQLELDKYSHQLDNLKASEDGYNDAIEYRKTVGLRITKDYYQNLINNGNEQIKNYEKQRQSYKGLMDELIRLYGQTAKESDKYKEYEKTFNSLDNSIRDTTKSVAELRKEMANLQIQELAWQFESLTAEADRFNNAMSLHEAQGIVETSKAYKDLIDNGMEQIKILEQENVLYRQQQKGMDVASEKYQELEGKIRSNISAIEDMKVSQEQWNDSIVDIGISQIEKQRDLLSKTNEEYERQKELQKALLNLEKARTQRKVRTYVEGQGFVYQSSEDDLREAQEALEDVISNQLMDRLDMLIDALEESKNNTNVYDANGNLLGTSYSTPQLGTLTSVLSNYEAVRNAGLDINVLKDTLGRNILNTTGTSSSNTSFNIGDIIVNEAKDGNELAQAIVNQFPNALLQALYKK